MFRSLIRSLVVCAAVLSAAASARANSLVSVDTPRQNAVVPSTFLIGGWAINLDAAANTGISHLHVWAYCADGRPPFFVGEATLGVARPDVAAVFGWQFAQAGFNLVAHDFAPGNYTLALTPYSSITNAFEFSAVAVVPITVAAPPPSSGTELRVLQWNTHHGGVGTDGVYSPDRLATWAANMNPDVILFNEIEKNDYWGHQDQPEVYRSLLEQKTGRTWYYVFAQEFGQWSADGKGNLILSTYPLDASARYEIASNNDRSVALATVTVKGRTVTFLSTHLDPYDQTLRLTQATEVVGWGASQPENRIIAGDMNSWPDQSPIAEFDGAYQDTWAVAAANGTAIAFPGNSGETRSGRIDYIFASKGAANLAVKSSQVYDTRDAAGVMPSDHRPVLTTFIVK